MAGLCAPLSTLRQYPRGYLRMTRGRCGSLLLHRDGLAPSTPCRSPGALRFTPRLCEKSREPRKRRIVFSIAVFRPRLPVQLVSVSMKLRQIFYTQIERRTFHTALYEDFRVKCYCNSMSFVVRGSV